MAEWMVESSGMTADPKARPWNAQARKYLKGLLLAAHLSGRRRGGSGPTGSTAANAPATRRGHPPPNDCRSTAPEYASTWQIHEEGKGSVLFTALGLADTYSRPGVMRRRRRRRLPRETCFEQSGTLCIVTPSGEGDRFAPYFTALVSAVIHAAETRAAAAGGPIQPPPAAGARRGRQRLPLPAPPAPAHHLPRQRRPAAARLPRPRPGRAPLRRPRGRPHRAVQRQDADAAAGRRRPRHPALLVGADGPHPHPDPRRDPQPGRHRSRSRNEHTDALAPLHVLQQLPDGRAVLLYQNLPPARVDLLPWFGTSATATSWTKTTAAKSSP